MPMPKATCLTCHRLIAVGESYCSAHTRKPKARPKASATARGLGYTYQKNRGVCLSLSRLCVLCGKQGANTADHIIPREHGGNESLWNLTPAHGGCNSSRQDKPLTPEQTARVHAYQRGLAVYLSTQNANA